LEKVVQVSTLCCLAPAAEQLHAALKEGACQAWNQCFKTACMLKCSDLGQPAALQTLNIASQAVPCNTLPARESLPAAEPHQF